MSDWPEYAHRASTWSVKKIVWVCFALVIALALVVSLLGFAFSWWGTAKDVVSPSNVKAQYAAVIGDFQALQTSAANACSASSSSDAGDSAPVLVEDPTLAYAATYRRIAADYNRRMANIFEAKIAGPSGYPATVPIVATTKVDWCEVSDQIAAVGP